jgi:hypothetical protein
VDDCVPVGACRDEDHVHGCGHLSKQRDARLHQSWPFVGCGILWTARSAAVVPDPYRLQACNADDATSFDNHPSFHSASVDRLPGGDNALFGEGTTSHSRKRDLINHRQVLHIGGVHDCQAVANIRPRPAASGCVYVELPSNTVGSVMTGSVCHSG